LTYVQEQEALRKETISAFKTAVTSDDEGGHASDNNDFLVPREKTKDEVEQEEEEYREFLEREIGPNVNIKELITVDDQVERIHEEGEGETRIQSNKPKKKKKSEKSKQRSEESEQDFLIKCVSFSFLSSLETSSILRISRI
jgi:protein KRI1